MMRNDVDLIEFNFTGYLRLILMLFVCFWAFGCPEPSGVVTSLSGFAIPCLYYRGIDNIKAYIKQVRYKRNELVYNFRQL